MVVYQKTNRKNIKVITKNIASQLQGKPILVTGANGFVSSYLIPRLKELGSVVHGIDIHEYPKFEGYTYHCCNLLDFNDLNPFIAQFCPSYVFHLASQSSVGTSWEHEWQTIEMNSKTTYNLLKALEKTQHQVRLLLVSSIEVYGDHGMRKVKVGDELRPANPYAASKAITEMIAHKFQNSPTQYVIARSSNHTGPGRPETFFEANIAKKFAEAKNAGLDSITLSVGNVDNIRDFSDVRDVVDKYLFLVARGESGKAFNVCSGEGIKLKKIISMLEGISQITADINIDNSRLRKNDIAYLVGISSVTSNNRSFSETIADLYNHFLDQGHLDEL